MTTPSVIGGKSSSTQPSSSYSTPFTQAVSSNFDSNRRPVQGSPSIPIAAPRKGQGQRKQHRNQKRPSFREDEDDMAEIRAIRNASSRRGQTSITHLLDYSSPRPHVENHHYSYNRNYRRNPSWGAGSGYHAADKARYVHANYRFIVSPKGDYSKQAIDADEHINWDDVLQVLASAESQAASCPICLSEPVAPRMAKCGHIFCLPCLIRFMHTSVSDEPTSSERKQRWRKCPICDDTIYISDTRPVRFYAGQESPLPRPGDDVVLRLMMRYDKSTLALPKEGGAEVLSSGDEIPWHFAANVLDYARIMRGTTEYMAQEYDREIEELAQQEKEDELMFNEDGEWTQKAIKAIEAAKDKVKDLGEVEVALAEASKTAGPNKSRQPDHDFYFYTSPPHLYLSPLDIRILKTKYGAFSQFPSTLLPRVEHISTGNAVDDVLRKRAKYLGHLPRGCLVSFLECDWTDIVPDEILESFKDEIEKRRKRNREKEVQEERERLQAERIESAAYRRGAGRTNLSTVDEFTIRFSDQGNSDRLNLDEFQPLGAVGTTPPNPRPGFSSLASMSTSPSAQRTVWGTPAIPTSPGAGPAEPPSDMDDGWLKEDQFLDSLGPVELAVQMEALGVENPTPEGSSSNTGGGKGKKKKQKQKITLMSTGGRRGN